MTLQIISLFSLHVRIGKTFGSDETQLWNRTTDLCKVNEFSIPSPNLSTLLANSRLCFLVIRCSAAPS